MNPVPDDQTILSIDPGNVDSAYCYLTGRKIGPFGKQPNSFVLDLIDRWGGPYNRIVCECITSYGMPAGASLFDTCTFIGRIIERADRIGVPVTLMPRIQVKSHICHSGKATDSNIRQALIDKYGPQGKKSAPGPTFGISADVWSALAIADTFQSGDYTPYILSADKPENLPSPACPK